MEENVTHEVVPVLMQHVVHCTLNRSSSSCARALGDTFTTSEGEAQPPRVSGPPLQWDLPLVERKTPSWHCLARLVQGWTLSARWETCPGLRRTLGGVGWSGHLLQVRGRVPALELEQLDSDPMYFTAQLCDLEQTHELPSATTSLSDECPDP